MKLGVIEPEMLWLGKKRLRRDFKYRAIFKYLEDCYESENIYSMSDQLLTVY